MKGIFASYLRYARGISGELSPWALLRPFGALYSLGARMRDALIDRGIIASEDPVLPVISVGNLCNGGTNKTPLVAMIARGLADAGIRAGIVSRGYSGESREPIAVDLSLGSPRDIYGDEPMMLARWLPDVDVVVARERLAGVAMLADRGAQVAVADDAFQHRRMARDVDIVLIDAACPFGNGHIFPAGTMREGVEALARAHIVVITKVEQASPDAVGRIREIVAERVPHDRIFTARMGQGAWLGASGDPLAPEDEPSDSLPLFAFSAIGSPDSFVTMLESSGRTVAGSAAWRDHHRFVPQDIAALEAHAIEVGARAFVCTEKDLQNLPAGAELSLPLYVPRIDIDVDGAFWPALADALRPRLIVTSNGHGEDAIGARVACDIRDRFPEASVCAFPLVGSGREYAERGIEVVGAASEMPSGGVVKYSLKALIGDLRHGLGRDIARQVAAWRVLRRTTRAPICVGDVYLLLIALWGQGRSPLLLATAKSARTNGHFLIERSLMRRRCRAVLTRDSATADELSASGVRAMFRGSPIMDLARETGDDDPWSGMPRPHVMLLPGSRPRAYDDVVLLADAVRELASRGVVSYVMIVAPTTDKAKIIDAAGFDRDGEDAKCGEARIAVRCGDLAAAAAGADVLIGLGGTANQICAGLGVPVVSIDERGKRAQKKLLLDAEVLVEPTASALADEVSAILADDERRAAMAAEGRRLLGGAGASKAVCDLLEGEMGLAARCEVWRKMSAKK